MPSRFQAMTNDKIRMSNETASPKPTHLAGFVIVVSNFIRHSNFVIRHSFVMRHFAGRARRSVGQHPSKKPPEHKPFLPVPTSDTLASDWRRDS